MNTKHSKPIAKTKKKEYKPPKKQSTKPNKDMIIKCPNIILTVRRTVKAIGRENSLINSINNIKKTLEKSSPVFPIINENLYPEIKQKSALIQKTTEEKKVNSSIPQTQKE